MAKKKRTKRAEPFKRVNYRYLAWAMLAGAWLLVAASLLSFDPVDPPAHAYGVPNTAIQNWVGAFGAGIAHHLYLNVGPGVWVAMLGLAIYLVVRATGRQLTQLFLRAMGLAVMTIAVSALVGVAQPAIMGTAAMPPEGAGGLTGLFVNDQLVTRFATPGTMLILLVSFWVGAILVADSWVMALSTKMGQGAMWLTTLRPAQPMLAAMGPINRLRALRLPWRATRTAGGRGAAAVAGRGKIPLRSSRSRRRDEEDEIDEDAGGFAATESFGTAKCSKAPGADDPALDDDEELEDDQAQTDEAPGAYVSSKKKFDPDELRAKIKQLPINFAPRTNKSAMPPPREVDLSGYEFPSIHLLEEPESDFTAEMEQVVREQAVELESALQQYHIEGEVVGIDSGPVISLFEARLAPGTKVARINAVASDLARAIKAQNIRIVPNMAGKDTVGIEVPNLKKESVRLRELMTSGSDKARKMKLPMFLGKDASGNPLMADLATMPHMLIAGTTGSGKSVCMNAIIMSFLFTKRPDELKLVLVDPKMVEMSLFKDIPHLMCPVVTEMTKAAAILEWATTKMDERYKLLAEVGVRDIASYNDLGWDEIKERMEPSTPEEEARMPRRLPFLVFVIDELADLMMTAKEVEGSIVRIAQKARAVGIHMILATQRPQANVVTGLIKSNMPCRVSFKVASGMDSRIVLDQKGGELLLGQGDMLFLSPRTSKVMRAQGCLVDDFEIRKTVKFLKSISQQSFEPQLVQIKSPGVGEDDAERDPLFNDAVGIVLETRRGSVSLLQRRLTIGYSRASRLIEQIANAGIIGEYKGSQAREVTISLEEWEAIKAQAQADADADAPPPASTPASQTVDRKPEEQDADEYEDEDEDEDASKDEDDDEEDEDDDVEEDDDEEEDDDFEYEDDDDDDDDDEEEDDDDDEEDE